LATTLTGEVVQKGRSIRLFNFDTMMPDFDQASPAFNQERRSRIKYGMTHFLDSLTLSVVKFEPLLHGPDIYRHFHRIPVDYEIALFRGYIFKIDHHLIHIERFFRLNLHPDYIFGFIVLGSP